MGPSQVLTRAATLLRIAEHGVETMATADITLVTHGFLDVVVFGRSVTLVMQRLRHWDESGFDDWYAPWSSTMKSDELLKFFNRLRREVIHGYTPEIGVAIAVFGLPEPQVGQVTLMDFELPRVHLDRPIDDQSTLNLCRLYVDFMKSMFESFAPLGWEIQDRETTGYWRQVNLPTGSSDPA